MSFAEQIDCASMTDVGVRRSHNQDNHVVLLATDEAQWAQHGHIFVVADGMGAHAVGEKASEQATRVIPHTYQKHCPEGAANALRKAISEANASIHAFGQANREFEGTGTTSTTLVLRPDGAWVGHVGDSRVYRVRDGYIDQLSYDHSKVWEYARLKHIDPAQVKDVATNVIYRCLGPEPLVEVDVEGPHSFHAGDTFVLCSDGLSGQMTDRELGAVVTVLPPAEACRFLIHLANLRGGPDNITVLIVRVNVAPEINGMAGEFLASPPPRRAPPWPLASFIAGTVLAVGAMILHSMGVYGSMAIFLAGSASILAGLVGLILQASHERGNPINPKKALGAHVYRRTACAIDAGLVDKLSRAVEALRHFAEVKHWKSDWTAYQKHHTEALEHLARQNYAGAFRSYCRALMPLADTLQAQRHKEEEFKPVWDKST